MSARKRNPRTAIEERIGPSGTRRYRASVYDPVAGRALKGPWSASPAQARGWRIDALARLQSGELTAHVGPTIREAAEQFLAGIESGAIVNRSSRPYRASTVRGYRRELNDRILPAFGATRMSRLQRPEVQKWADGLSAEGLAAQSVRNIVTALRALYGWGISVGMAPVNPCTGLRLPTGGKTRDRIPTPSEGARLTEALEPRDQAAFGLALYGGLRLGEVLALDWVDVDLDAATLRVRRGWDHGEHRFIEPKSRAGHRILPIVGRLARLLADHRVLTDHRPGLLFPAPSDPSRPVSQSSLTARIKRTWKAAELDGIGFHQARHVAASVFIAAGLNVKAVSTFMGHANVAITFDRYGHLLPGAEDEARGLLDRYLAAHDG